MMKNDTYLPRSSYNGPYHIPGLRSLFFKIVLFVMYKVSQFDCVDAFHGAFIDPIMETFI